MSQELDAAVMEGSELKAGAVASVSCFAQPSRAALAVLRSSPHVLIVGRGAEDFCSSPLGGGLPRCDPASLVLPRERQNHLDWLAAGRPDARTFFKEKEWVGEDGPRRGTVGVVLAVRDDATQDDDQDDDEDESCARWRLFAGTSTGGTPGKLVGRVGDVPIVGGGLYADDEGAAVSCSGWGEGLMRLCAARDVSALCQQGVHPQQAVEQTLLRLHRRVGGHGGIIAVDKRGRLGAAFSTPDFAVAADESCTASRLAL
jgi:beta-aspartyl-peptidase (threonine type)